MARDQVDDDHYATLQVAPHACQGVIDAAFAVLREAACQDDCPEGMRMLVALNRAHHTLRDSARRAQYDDRRAGR